jgi:hypothetical protein
MSGGVQGPYDQPTLVLSLAKRMSELLRARSFFGGEGGIRTHGSLATSPHFECGALVHYATSPKNYSAYVFL